MIVLYIPISSTVKIKHYTPVFSQECKTSTSLDNIFIKELHKTFKLHLALKCDMMILQFEDDDIRSKYHDKQ